MLGSSPRRGPLPGAAGDVPAAGLTLAAALEVPASAARTVALWYAAVALLGLLVLLAVAVAYGRHRGRR